MVSRGFYNDGHPDRARSSASRDEQQAIVKTMRRGSGPRQYLEQHGRTFDSEAWRGESGVAISRTILETALEHIDSQPQPLDDRQEALRQQCLDTLAKLSVNEGLSQQIALEPPSML